MAKQNDLLELKHELLTTSATIQVFAYKMEQFNQMQTVSKIDHELEQ